jgi:hypothetical protein
VLKPTEAEAARLAHVLDAVAEAVDAGAAVRLPQARLPVPEGLTPDACLGLEPNEFGGEVAGIRYQFEGEEDLLHLVVSRGRGGALPLAEARAVAEFALPGVPPGLVWHKAGATTHHFYVGHDVLVEALRYR